MKICLDGFSISSLEGTGLYSYSHGLIKQLVEHCPQGDYHLLWDDSPTPIWESVRKINYPNLRVNRVNGDLSSLENYLKIKDISVYHSPNNGFSLPSNKICKYVITVQDLIVLTNERYVDEQYKRKFLTFFPSAVKFTDKIIAVSNSIKQDLLTYFPISEDKIEVIYPTSTLPITDNRNINGKNLLKYKYDIESPFIFYAGSIHSRKNLRTLLVAFKGVLKEHPSLKLVISGKNNGKRSSYFNGLISLANLLEIRDSVIFTGLVPLQDMYYFYSQCQCFINLSEYEGFPLTCFEAMECGTPVICSSIPAMKEVVGNGGILINQRDDKEIASNILKIIDDTQYREKLKASGYRQVKSFNNSLNSNKLIDLYKALI
jgi:glycosyltransferase involved in cell wall biosynthesis